MKRLFRCSHSPPYLYNICGLWGGRARNGGWFMTRLDIAIMRASYVLRPQQLIINR